MLAVNSRNAARIGVKHQTETARIDQTLLQTIPQGPGRLRRPSISVLLTGARPSIAYVIHSGAGKQMRSRTRRCEIAVCDSSRQALQFSTIHGAIWGRPAERDHQSYLTVSRPPLPARHLAERRDDNIAFAQSDYANVCGGSLISRTLLQVLKGPVFSPLRLTRQRTWR